MAEHAGLSEDAPDRGPPDLRLLTCEPNDAVGRIHPKAMPVILASAADIETWLSADCSEALQLQRPLDGDELIEVALCRSSPRTGAIGLHCGGVGVKPRTST